MGGLLRPYRALVFARLVTQGDALGYVIAPLRGSGLDKINRMGGMRSDRINRINRMEGMDSFWISDWGSGCDRTYPLRIGDLALRVCY